MNQNDEAGKHHPRCDGMLRTRCMLFAGHPHNHWSDADGEWHEAAAGESSSMWPEDLRAGLDRKNWCHCCHAFRPAEWDLIVTVYRDKRGLWHAQIPFFGLDGQLGHNGISSNPWGALRAALESWSPRKVWRRERDDETRRADEQGQSRGVEVVSDNIKCQGTLCQGGDGSGEAIGAGDGWVPPFTIRYCKRCGAPVCAWCRVNCSPTHSCPPTAHGRGWSKKPISDTGAVRGAQRAREPRKRRAVKLSQDEFNTLWEALLAVQVAIEQGDLSVRRGIAGTGETLAEQTAETLVMIQSITWAMAPLVATGSDSAAGGDDADRIELVLK